METEHIRSVDEHIENNINNAAPKDEDDDYILETPIALRKLYLMLIDMYDNSYPIPFVEFRRRFEIYMKLTENNLIDSCILLIYGIRDLDKMGHDEEQISSNRIKGKTFESEVQVSTPIFRFVTVEGEIIIGYDYAYSIQPEHIEVEGAEEKKIVDIKMKIDPDACVIEWEFNKKLCKINMKELKFNMILEGEPYVMDSTFVKIDKQPVPNDEVVKESYANSQVIVSELESGNQFVYHAGSNNFDYIIRDKHLIERQFGIYEY